MNVFVGFHLWSLHAQIDVINLRCFCLRKLAKPHNSRMVVHSMGRNMVGSWNSYSLYRFLLLCKGMLVITENQILRISAYRGNHRRLIKSKNLQLVKIRLNINFDFLNFVNLKIPTKQINIILIVIRPKEDNIFVINHKYFGIILWIF